MEVWFPRIVSWLTPFVTPVGQKAREVILYLLINQPLEFRVALLSWQIRSLFAR